MIPLKRMQAAPQVLVTKGAERTRRDGAAYEAAIAAGQKFEFVPDKGIYGHQTVREALIEMQHGKCCFCEQIVQSTTDGDVEHFRPKQGFKQDASSPLERPSYFWLAYTWSNLLFACPQCNQRHKQNLFPLADPNQRARRPCDDLARESPLFINPYDESNIESLIGWRRHVPFPVDDNAQGRETISALGLGPTARKGMLSERRRQRFDLLSILRDGLAPGVAPATRDPAGGQWDNKARAVLKEAQSDQAEFAAMARALLRGVAL
jgi:hypothetical protein